MIPDNVEKIIMTKEDYDRNVEQLLVEKCKAELEIDRLNNIIDELEEFLNKVVETGASIEQITCKNILNYLQELKENNNVKDKR